LDLPEEIRKRPPTTDTYSLPQSQEVFYFSLPYQQTDECLCARNQGLSLEEAATRTSLTAEQITRVYADIDSKRRSTSYQHERPLLIEPMAGPKPGL